MRSSITTPFPGGVTNASLAGVFAKAGVPDPAYSQVYHNEFNTYVATDFTTTLVGLGTTALVAEIGGVLLDTTTAGATDAIYHQLPVAGYQFATGKPVFFKARLKPSDQLNSGFYAGLLAISATPLVGGNGVFLYKATGVTTWILRVIIAGVAQDLALPASFTAAAATYAEVGFWVDSLGAVAAFFNAPTGQQVMAYQAPQGFCAAFIPTALPTVLLAPSFGIINGAAAVKTLSCDYITVSAER